MQVNSWMKWSLIAVAVFVSIGAQAECADRAEINVFNACVGEPIRAIVLRTFGLEEREAGGNVDPRTSKTFEVKPAASGSTYVVLFLDTNKNPIGFSKRLDLKPDDSILVTVTRQEYMYKITLAEDLNDVRAYLEQEGKKGARK